MVCSLKPLITSIYFQMGDNKARKRSASPLMSQEQIIADLRSDLSKVKALHRKVKELLVVKEEIIKEYEKQDMKNKSDLRKAKAGLVEKDKVIQETAVQLKESQLRVDVVKAQREIAAAGLEGNFVKVVDLKARIKEIEKTVAEKCATVEEKIAMYKEARVIILKERDDRKKLEESLLAPDDGFDQNEEHMKKLLEDNVISLAEGQILDYEKVEERIDLLINNTICKATERMAGGTGGGDLGVWGSVTLQLDLKVLDGRWCAVTTRQLHPEGGEQGEESRKAVDFRGESSPEVVDLPSSPLFWSIRQVSSSEGMIKRSLKFINQKHNFILADIGKLVQGQSLA